MWIVWLEKKILKTLGIILGIIIILVTALHIYVVNNAERLIEELVDSESKGKLKLKVDNIKFNYFSKKVELDGVTFYSNDSLDLNTSYHFQIDKIKLKVKALIPIFTEKELRIDSLALFSPKIEVTRLKPLRDSIAGEVSIPREMGRIYNSIMDALKFLEVKRFQFDDGQFKLINKILPDQQPLVITRMHFHIENFKVDSTTNAEDFPESDKLVFWTKGQDITFPDGNHRLAFSRFRIKIKKRLIEIDSCTLIGKKGGSSQSGFSLFLDTLKLTKVDFKSLYETGLIKADSVSCSNPNFKIQLELKNKTAGKSNIPNLDTLINQLTGDIQLGYIGVKNASVNIATTKNDKNSSFTSDKNNFEMTGLRIDHSLPQPVSLEGFDMAIRNYENFLKDSSYFLRFDSIRLRETRILLSNFSINTVRYKDNRNIQVRQFVLSGLSWGELLFDRKIIARQATLIRPVIDYVQPARAKQKSRGLIANSLAGLDNFMSLEKILVENGTIKIKTRSQVELMLDDANLSLKSNNISDSLSIENAENSIELLNFKKGVMKTKSLMVNMDNAFFDGNSKQFLFEKINIYNHKQTFNVNAKDVTLDSLIFRDSLNSLTAEGIDWKKAELEINLLGEDKTPVKNPLSFLFKKIHGNNTQLYLNSPKSSLAIFLNEVSASSVNNKEKIAINKFKSHGSNLYWFDQQSSISSDKFSIEDFAVSSFTGFQFKQAKLDNSTELKAPGIMFTPDINSFIKGNPILENVKLTDPSLAISIKSKPDSAERKALPNLSINQIEIEHPVFSMENIFSKGLQKIYWKSSGNSILMKDVDISKTDNNVNIASIKTRVADFTFTNVENKTTSSKKGSLDMTLSDLKLKPGKQPEWSVMINEVDAKNFTADSLGKKPAMVNVYEGVLKNLVLGTAINGDIKTIIQKNPSFTISNVSGSIIDEKNNWRWNNFSFSRPDQILTLDSFAFHPVMNRDAFVAASPWEIDYMTLKTGKVNISNFNADQYLNDSTFRAGNLSINNPYFTSYRDKRPPFKEGIIKPLASKLILRIPLKVSIDTIQISNGTAVYTELNDKTNEAGEIPITRINGDIFPIKNYGITTTDSLRIRLNGYLLDTGWIRLRTRESYTDTASGFIITVRMRPHSLMYLNKVLVPLASIKLQSAYLDTLVMRAVGYDHLALGEMRMYYHNLKVQFLKDGKEDQKRFLQGLITFIANSFVIKNENKKRVGVVYFPRLRDRSFINYYIKIAMSGVASSVGAKKNKRLLRRYEKQLKLRQLPTFDFD